MADKGIGDAYHKARRQLAFFSGILLVWQYIGVRVGDQTTSAVTVPVTETTLIIQNPQVIPVVIAVVTFYFTFRFAVEWYRIDPALRAPLAARLDANVAFVLAGAALVVFGLQTATDFVLADLLTPEVALGLVFSFKIAGITVLFVRRELIGKVRSKAIVGTPTKAFLAYLVCCVAILLILAIIARYLTQLGMMESFMRALSAVYTRSDPIGLGLGLAVATLIVWFTRPIVFRMPERD